MDNVSRPLWRLLVLTSEPEKAIQLTCAECFALLEYDADLLAAGAALDEIRPAVIHHLSLCSACQAKFDGWLTMPEGDAKASARSELDK
jgi:hypothetical protein